MDFLFGFLVGRFVSSDAKETIIALLLFPFVLLLFTGAGFLMYYAADWYTTSAAQPHIAAAWYAYPWNWPGVQLVERATHHLQDLYDIQPQPGLTSVFAVFLWLLTSVKAVFAAMINTMTVVLPLHIVGVTLEMRRENSANKRVEHVAH